MATGKLGGATLTAATQTTLYTVPTGKITVCTLNLCNTGDVEAHVRVAVAAANPPVAGEYIEYNATIPPYGVLERAGLVLDAARLIVVYADVANVNVVSWGYEE